uniref:Uncharacterized protein n=1 Tax=Anopheles coluzzii TaxID=1518534 RepID=A0A6E8W5C4_ANOCL
MCGKRRGSMPIRHNHRVQGDRLCCSCQFYHSKRMFVLLSCSSGREFMPTRVQLNLSARAKRREINVVPTVLNNGGGPFHLCSSQVQYRANMMFEAFVVGT